MIRLLFTIVLLAALLYNADSYRILAVYTFPARSHHVVFNVLTNELASRGHELVVITTNPQNNNNVNITEIEVKEVTDLWMKGFISTSVKNSLKRGVKWSVDMIGSETRSLFGDMADAALSNKEVRELISDKNQKFDLIIAEAILNYPLIFAEVFDAPFIWFSSSIVTGSVLKAMGAPASHPFLNPNIYRNRIYNLSLWEKIYALYAEGWLAYNTYETEKLEEKAIKKHFGENALTLNELKNKVDLLLMNAHSAFYGNNPVPPGVIHLGGLHLKPVKDLPQDLKKILDDSKNGVVYVSFGTNVLPSMMDEDLLESFLEAFEALPYDFLWKFDADLPRKPKNVHIAKWWPQRDLLNHTNVKAFITQAGLQSTDEAIDSGVPMIGMPMLAEQNLNAERYEQLGIGVSIDVTYMTADDLVRAVSKVVEDTSYKKNIVELAKRIRDQPQSPLQRAVWWTEHALRHRGAAHLRCPAANVAWADYLMLDVVLSLAVALVSAISMVAFLLSFLLSILRGKSKVKVN